mmetsp:Transcript_38846/g.60686  ORF Transcript_38846/g.60686 Transcript_38846/m.60686 type:complete len:190 (-) Transcript_38846:264-833(-)
MFTFQRDFYRVLGLSNKANSAEIKKAYFKLAQQWHPDINKSKEAVEKFRRIAEAYETLGNTSKKAIYDAESIGLNTARRHRPPPDSTNKHQKARSRHQHTSEGGRLFEKFTHPVILGGGGILAFVGFLANAKDTSQEYIQAEKNATVAAWFNPRTQRYETPSPWDPLYKENKHTLAKVKKSLVYETRPS